MTTNLVGAQLCATALLLLPLAAQAVSMRLCTDERPHPPYTMPDASGSVDRMLVGAAAQAGIELTFRAAPVVRCKEHIAADAADGVPATAQASPGALMVPMRNGAPDPSRAVATGRLKVFRTVGSSVDWDGKRFTGLDKPVLVPFGTLAAVRRVAQMKLPLDDRGDSLDQTFAKLLAGRGNVAVGLELDGAFLLSQPPYAGKIEALPLAFGEDPYYFGVSRKFYAAHGPAVERMWDAIGRLRAAGALVQPAKPLKK